MKNYIIKSALGSANIPSVLEPPGLATLDNNGPDGLTWMPWEKGMCLIWDETVVNALAPTRISNNTCQLSAATEAELRKSSKNSEILNRGDIFAPVAFEVQGGCGHVTYSFLRALVNVYRLLRKNLSRHFTLSSLFLWLYRLKTVLLFWAQYKLVTGVTEFFIC